MSFKQFHFHQMEEMSDTNLPPDKLTIVSGFDNGFQQARVWINFCRSKNVWWSSSWSGCCVANERPLFHALMLEINHSELHQPHYIPASATKTLNAFHSFTANSVTDRGSKCEIGVASSNPTPPLKLNSRIMYMEKISEDRTRTWRVEFIWIN